MFEGKVDHLKILLISDEQQIENLKKDFPNLSVVTHKVKFESKIKIFHKILATKQYILPAFNLSNDVKKILAKHKFDFIFNFWYNVIF